MRVAVWGPLAPDPGGPAEESALVLPELARHVEVVAIVRDEVLERTVVPAGVEAVPASRYGPYGVDLDVYHLANPVRPHAYVHRRALERPGVTVLHEPSLAGFYASLCGSARSPLLDEVARAETGQSLRELPRLAVGARRVVDPLAVLYSPRVVTASLCTVVDSHWAAGELSARCPGAALEVIPRAAPAADGDPAAGGGDAVVVLSHGAPADLLAAALGALRGAREALGDVELVVAGPPGDLAGPTALALLREGQGSGRARVVTSGPGGELAPLLGAARLVVALEWPSHGGTSPLVAASLAAGTPVVVADHPQYAGLEAPAVRRVPATDPETLAGALRGLLAGPEAGRELAAARGPAARLGAAHAAPVVAERLASLLGRFGDAEAHRRRLRRAAPDAGWPPAVNAIASFEATTGLAEAARRYVGALATAGVRVALEDYDYGWAPRQAHRLSDGLRALPRGRPYDVELCYLNVNELHIVPERYLRTPRHRRHLVGFWFWELPDLPRSLHEQVARVDEVWVPSPFVAEVFAPHTARPVRVVPCVVEPERDERLTRADFGLSSSRRCYFFHFDANSTLARKNPFAVIEAFARAFPGRRRDDVQLVMKTLNLGRHPEAAAELRARMAEVDGVIIDDDLTLEAMGSLTALCDVYVSLHRGEGFGLGPAEAMYFAKPVIATAYSGNLAFMSTTNSCLVGYRMTEVTLGELRYNPGAEAVYEPGQRWADPDLDDAVSWMRFCHEEPAATERLAGAGARTIRQLCSREAVGRRMRELLEGTRPE